MKLTDIVIRNLASPLSGQRTYPDDTISGFGVRVSPRGTKTFTLVHGRNRARTTIGRYPVIGLAEARTQAKRILAERVLGKHQPQRTKFEVALEQFYGTHVAQKRNPQGQKEIRRVLNKHLLPALRHENLGEVTTQAIMKVVDRLFPTPSECLHLFAAAKTFFRWAVRRRLILHSPLEGLESPTKYISRDRVLTDEELAIVLAQAKEQGSFGVFIQLLLLTGQRKGEIASLTAGMIETAEKTITLPTTKNGRPHTFPYGDAVTALLQELPRAGPLFPGRRKHLDEGPGEISQFNGFSKATDAFRTSCGIQHWTLHDLRRTYATGLARLGVAPQTIEALLNHVTGTLSVIARVYNRHSYLPEARAAAALWENHIASLTNPVILAPPE
jgi:integrase